MLKMKSLLSNTIFGVGILGLVLSTSYYANETIEDSDEFLASLDEDAAEAPLESDEQSLVSDQELDTESTTDTAASVDKDVEDFAIDKNYETFDPTGIVVRFEFDSHELTAETVAALDKIVAGLKKDALARIFVRGHADKQGPEGYNDDLSHKQAERIGPYVGNGIDKERLITIHLGETEPLIDEHSVRAKQNRRGDFSLDYGGGAFSAK